LTDTHFQAAILLAKTAAGNCPNANVAGAVFEEFFGAGAGGQAGGENIVDEEDAFLVEFFSSDVGEGIFDVGDAVVEVEVGLRVGVADALHQIGAGWNAGCGGKAGGEAFGLVEAAAALFPRVQRNGDDEIDWLEFEIGRSVFDEKFGEEGFEPFFAIVFEAMDDLFDEAVVLNGGAGRGELEFEVEAISAGESERNLAFIPEAADFAERRADRADGARVGAAVFADEGIGGGRFAFAAEFTDVRENEAEQARKEI
jgi:hypothetical protein